MWSSRLFWKLFVVYAGLTLALTIGLLLIVFRWQADYATQETHERLQRAAAVLRDQVEADFGDLTGNNLQSRLDEMSGSSDIRFTILQADGNVLADSDEEPGDMENHINRPEVREATVRGVGAAERYSSTLKKSMYYVAMPVYLNNELQGFVRAAASSDAISARGNEISRLVWGVAIAFGVVAILATYLVVGRMIQPLAELLECSRAIARGDYSHRVHVFSRDELGMLALAFNHMQQKLASQVNRLEENSERLETVLGSMREGVLAVDNQQRVLFANEASRLMLGIRSGEIVGRPLVEATRVRPVHEAVEQVLRHNKTLENEFESNTSRRRIVAMRAARLPGGPTPGAVLVLHDISELRRLENLRQEFVANVSHELKTPLASIKAYAETLKMGAVNDPEHNIEFVSRIEEQGERLHQLILDLLHIARVESGEESFEIGTIDVAQIMNRIEPYFRRAAEERQLSFHLEPPAEPLFVAADDDGLRTILDNLVMNAIRYTPEQGSVTVRWYRDGDRCALEVADTGIGIAPSDQARIFERFYRVDKARSREMGGTGLGLAIVKHLTQAFNGTISLVSEVNHGSTFVVHLPLAAPSAVEAGHSSLES